MRFVVANQQRRIKNKSTLITTVDITMSFGNPKKKRKLDTEREMKRTEEEEHGNVWKVGRGFEMTTKKSTKIG